MTALWVLPLVVTLVGLVAVFLAGSRAAEEAELMIREIRTLVGLRPLLAEVQDASRRLSAARGGDHRTRGG